MTESTPDATQILPAAKDVERIALRDALAEQARALGFAAFGIAPPDLGEATRQNLRDWLMLGQHGDMGWMAERAEQRCDPRTLWGDTGSVIMLGMNYAPADDPLALERVGDRGRISVYARGADYHDIVKRALKALARWLVERQAGLQLKVFVDTAPVMEKPLGALAGLGWQGKHSNLVSRTHGSWLFLGAIYVNIDLPLDEPHRDHCGACTACQTACPTQAFTAPYKLDARACISYLTIENKGPIPRQYRRAMGNRIYGCDDCLAVCPWNKFAQSAAAHKAFLPRAELVAPHLGDLLALDDARFRLVFAGSPIKRIGRDRMVRNALIAAGNSGDLALLGAVKALLDDPAPVVRGAAVWALGRLDVGMFAEARAARMAAEDDADVQVEWRDL